MSHFYQQATITVVIPLRQFGFLSRIPVFRKFSHHVQVLHLITDKRPKMLVFRLIFVHQIHIVSFSFKII